MNTNPMPSQCPICGTAKLISRSGRKTFPFKVGSHLHSVTISGIGSIERASCHEAILAPQALAVIDRAQAVAAAKITPEELHTLREHLGLSFSSMAKVLGVG